MSVKINIPSHWQAFSGNKSVVEVSGCSTVGDCLSSLVERFPALQKILFDKDGKLFGDLGIYVNRKDAYPEDLAKPVKDGDELHIPSVIAGG